MDIKFDNTSLNSNQYTCTGIKHEESTPRETYIYNLARERGGIIVDTNYKPKEVVVVGRITGVSQANLEENIDTFKELLSREAKNLEITYATGTRRYKGAMATKVSINREYMHLTYAPYEATFLIPSGVGEDTTLATMLWEGITSSPLSDTMDTVGSAFPEPTITITINSITAGTAISLTINGDKITLTDTIIASDVIVFDIANKKVTLNGTEKDYTGIFPHFTVGENGFDLAVTSSARDYDLLLEYYPKYL